MRSNKKTISISINVEVLDWLEQRCKEWHVSRSWLIENMIYTALVKSGIIPDEHKEVAE